MQKLEVYKSCLVQKHNILKDLESTLLFLQIMNNHKFTLYIEALNLRLRYDKRKSHYIEGQHTYNVIQEIRSEIDCLQEAIKIYGNPKVSSTIRAKIDKRLNNDADNYRQKESIFHVYKDSKSEPSITIDDKITKYLTLLGGNTHREDLILAHTVTNGTTISIKSLIVFLQNQTHDQQTIVSIIEKYMSFDENGIINNPHQCLRSDDFIRELTEIGYTNDAEN